MANPNIIVKSEDTRPVKRVLTVRERESLSSAANVYGYANVAGDQYVPGSQGFGPVMPAHFAVNRPRLNEQQKQVLKVLRDGQPEPTTPDERDRLNKKAAELKAQFEPFLQTREEVHVLRRDNPAFFSALEKAKKWQTPQAGLNGRTPEQVAEDYRNIQRRLEPEDENADSLDRLRRAK